MNKAELLAAINTKIKPPTPPERIHGWQLGQMSIARFFGGLTYQGYHYTIAVKEPGQPLVRDDVLQREAKAAKAAKTERKQKQRAVEAQGELL